MRPWWLVVLGACGFSGRTPSVPDAAPADAILPIACPTGYDATVTAGIYRVVALPATWDAARADCRKDGPTTHLVVLGDDVERVAVRALITGDLWLGVTDRVTTGTWRWVTAEDTHGYPPNTVGTPPWKAGKPDNGDDGAQDCAEMQDSGLWDDKRCINEENAYVCECDGNAEVAAQSDPQS